MNFTRRKQQVIETAISNLSPEEELELGAMAVMASGDSNRRKFFEVGVREFSAFLGRTRQDQYEQLKEHLTDIPLKERTRWVIKVECI